MDAGTHQFLNSEFQRQQAIKQVENGTHPSMNGLQKRLVKEGRHHLLSGDVQRKFWQDPVVRNKIETSMHMRVKNKTHHFCNPEFQREMSLRSQKKRKK